MRFRQAHVLWLLPFLCWTWLGCRQSGHGPDGPGPELSKAATDEAPASSNSVAISKPAAVATAAKADMEAAVQRIAALGSAAKATQKDGLLTEIVIQDGSTLTADDFLLFGKLTDLVKLQIFNCRAANDAMAASLAGLKELKSLALTNSVINDPTVELIAKSFPKLTELDLSSNTNMTRVAMQHIAELTQLQSLSLVQTRFNDLSTRRLKGLQELRALDLRGNMEAGNMTLAVVGELPRLTAFKHRSTAVTDEGLSSLSNSQTLQNLLMQDFMVSDLAGQHLAKMTALRQLEIFRCQGFGSEGVRALKGLKLERLTLRDLPSVDDSGMEVFAELPDLRRLYLHELEAVTDEGFQNLEALQSLELLDVWSVPQITDASVALLAKLPKLKELSLRSTGITDAAVETLLAMPKLQSLTIKENSEVTEQGLKKLTNKKWTKLDIGG